jgi:hypothetical protein
VRAWGIFNAFGILHTYLLKLETLFCVDSERAEGWEHFLEGKLGEENGLRKTDASKFAVAFWATLVTTTLLIAIIFGFHIPN